MPSQSSIFILAVAMASWVHHSSAEEPHERAALDAHNNYRSKHCSQAMTLSTDLNKAAEKCVQEYAKRGVIDYKCSSKPNGVGENLYMSRGKGNDGDKSKWMRIALKTWYDEVRGYNYNRPEKSTGARHFTQLIWNASTTLGCSVAIVGRLTIVCCFYTPLGNIRLAKGDHYQLFKTNVKPPKGG